MYVICIIFFIFFINFFVSRSVILVSNFIKKILVLCKFCLNLCAKPLYIIEVLNIIMGFIHFFNKKTTEEEDTQQVKRYIMSDADREKSLQTRREKAEIKRMEQMQDAKVNYLKREIELAELQKEIKDLKGEDHNQEDQIINMAMSKLLGITGLGDVNPMAPAEAGNIDLTNFEEKIKQEAHAVPMQEEKVPQTPPKEEEPVQTRFSDDQLKNNLPKLLNKDQIEFLKTLSEDEIFQVYDIAKTL